MKKSLFKIKEGKTDLWITWCKFVMEKHYEEAVQTIDEEDLVREQCWVLKSKNGDYVYYEHEPKPGKVKLPWTREHTLNWLHWYILHACLEKTEVKKEELKGDWIVGYKLVNNQE